MTHVEGITFSVLCFILDLYVLYCSCCLLSSCLLGTSGYMILGKLISILNSAGNTCKVTSYQWMWAAAGGCGCADRS